VNFEIDVHAGIVTRRMARETGLDVAVRQRRHLLTVNAKRNVFALQFVDEFSAWSEDRIGLSQGWSGSVEMFLYQTNPEARPNRCREFSGPEAAAKSRQPVLLLQAGCCARGSQFTQPCVVHAWP